AFEVGSLIAGRGAIREVAAPFLRTLMLATKETVHLGVLDEWEVVYIDKMESDQPLQMYSRVGRPHSTVRRWARRWQPGNPRTGLTSSCAAACAPTPRRR